MRPNAKDVVIILPVLVQENKEDEVIFILTKRPPLEEEGVSEFCIELPAGLVGDNDKNETTMEAIKKELLEETGHEADKIEIILSKVSASGGLTSETGTLAKATITNPNIIKAPVDDGGVILKRIYIKKSNIKSFIKEQAEKGCAISAYALSALYFLN